MNYLIAQKDTCIKGSWILKGSKYTLNSEGYLHSFNDLPALIDSNESQYWYLNGEHHRSNGPAIIDPNRSQYWYLNGKHHRVDGPAVIFPDGTQSWWLNGKHHRSDGPAIIYPDGSQAWYLNGKPHRKNRPAVIKSNGSQYWFLNGKQVRPIKVLKLMKAKGVDITHFALDKNPETREAIKHLLDNNYEISH